MNTYDTVIIGYKGDYLGQSLGRFQHKDIKLLVYLNIIQAYLHRQ